MPRSHLLPAPPATDGGTQSSALKGDSGVDDTALNECSTTAKLGEDGNSLLKLEVAMYVGQMSAELSAMARRSDMALLSYFLDMAAAEARDAAGKLDADLHHGGGAADPETDQPLT